jgi:hypothetical protein
MGGISGPKKQWGMNTGTCTERTTRKADDKRKKKCYRKSSKESSGRWLS